MKDAAATADPTSSTQKNSRLKTTLRAFKHRNYRLYFFGQAISITGTWMQSIALSWLIYRLTDSVFMLGLIGFVLHAPNFFFAPIAGVFADRTSRFKMFFTTQVLAMIQALTLATLVLTDTVQVWHIVALAGMLGVINSFDFPSRQSMVVLLVEDKNDLSNAIALNSSMVNLARVLGPSLAGVLIALIGEGWCFLLNGISYIAVLGCLSAMRLRPQEATKIIGNVWGGFREGLSYAFNSPAIRAVLILLAFVSMVGMPYAALMPVFARDILHGDSRTLGFLMGATGLGAITAAIYLASRQRVMGLEKMLAIASTCLGTGLIALSFIREFWIAMPFMYLIGIGMISQIAVSNTILQTLVDEDKRGRVISLYVAAHVGMLPFGNLITGTLASAIGTPFTMLITGSLCVVASIAFSTHLRRWREYAYPIFTLRSQS
ncbi:MAG: MFS transporter [Candidatus Zixiibacteriota bacterium]